MLKSTKEWKNILNIQYILDYTDSSITIKWIYYFCAWNFRMWSGFKSCYYSKKFLYICLCFLFFYLIKNWWEIHSLLEKIKLLLILLFLNLTFHFEHSWLIIHLQWNGQFNFCSLFLSLLGPLVTIGNQTYNTMLQFTSFFLENIYSSSVKCFFYFVIINLWKKKSYKKLLQMYSIFCFESVEK